MDFCECQVVTWSFGVGDIGWSEERRKKPSHPLAQSFPMADGENGLLY